MLTLCIAAALLQAPKQQPAKTGVDATYRWFFLEANLQHPPEVDKALKTLDSAAAAGYNGVVFKDSTLQSLPRVPATYAAALTQVMGEAKKIGIEFIPSIAPIGSAASILQLNPSLAESMPCKNVHFAVTGGKLKPSDPAPSIVNGGFDAFTADLPNGFKAAAHAGVSALLDTAIKHGGAGSLRIEGLPATTPTNNVLYEQPITVLPWHQYRLSIWTKTLTAPDATVAVVPRTTAGQILGYFQWNNTPDWAKSVVVFNSQENTAINLQVAVHPGPTSKIWLDDLAIEDVGLLNVTRRDDCPIIIRGDDGAIFSEDVDVDEIKDVFTPPGAPAPALEVTHDATQPAVLGNSRLHESQVILLDYYAAALVDGKPTLCFNEPQAKALLRTEIKRVLALTHAHLLFLDINNVKVLGWDPGCEATGQSAGDMLASFVRDEAANVKAIDPTIQLATYSNMFDPDANAKDNYFFTKGGMSGASRGLPKNMIILNDDYTAGAASLGYFARMGNPQVLIGYVDGASSVLPIDQFMKIGSTVSGIHGFEYLTLTGDYSHLSDFGKAAVAAAH